MLLPHFACRPIAVAAAIAALPGPSVSCQTSTVAGTVALGRVRSVVDEPFSAQWTTTRVQTLEDGTQITLIEKEVRVRDRQGRVRVERYAGASGPAGSESASGNSAMPVSVEIVDPVGGQMIRLDPHSKTARVTQFSDQPLSSTRAMSPPLPVIAPPAVHPLPRPQFEQLGTQPINGVDATGTRITQVIPAGTQGNDRDLTVVHETWFSPELKVDLLIKQSDPRSGEATTEVQNLTLDEPDPALFQIPADYKITAPGGP